MRRTPITTTSDRTRELPALHEERVETILRARASLAAEEHRLSRLALEPALARCRDERRYWEFLHAVFQLAGDSDPRPEPRGDAWPRAAGR